MNNKYELPLIKGVFTPIEAKEVLLLMIGDKIAFHRKEIFSIKERNNGDSSRHEKRITELKEVQAAIKNIIKEAEEKGLQLQIQSTISIECLAQ